MPCAFVILPCSDIFLLADDENLSAEMRVDMMDLLRNISLITNHSDYRHALRAGAMLSKVFSDAISEVYVKSMNNGRTLRDLLEDHDGLDILSEDRKRSRQRSPELLEDIVSCNFSHWKSEPQVISFPDFFDEIGGGCLCRAIQILTIGAPIAAIIPM